MEKRDSEWLYSELLDLFKEKEKEKEDSYYRPIELELPLIQPPQPIGDELPKNENENEKDRGVVIIDL